MGFLTRFVGAESTEERGYSASLTNEEFLAGVTVGSVGTGSKAGKRVSPTSAMQASAVYACVRILSDAVSTLPLDSYVRSDGARRPYRPRPAFLDFEQGPYTKVDVLSQVMVSLLLYGNAYLATYRDGEGRIIWMEPLDPTQLTPKFTPTGSVVYEVSATSSVLGPMEILHVRGLGMPGELEGLSPITVAKETIGLGLASTEYGAAFFGNSAVPGMVVEVPGKLSPAGADALRRSWNDIFQGSGNANKLAVATDGAKLSKVTLSNTESQFLETRKFQINDIARIFGVPTSLLQHSDGPEMGQSIQDKNTQFVQHSLRPWVERIEIKLTEAIRSEGINPRAFVKINLDGLLRGDHQTRYSTYAQAVTQGILTINEVRRFEDLAPVPWGDDPISVQVQEATPDANSTPSEEEENA